MIILASILIFNLVCIPKSAVSSQSPAIEWSKTYGDDIYDRAHQVIQTSDGGFCFVGSIYESQTDKGIMWVIKTNENGILEWEKTYEDDQWSNGASLQQTTDGGYILLAKVLNVDESDSDIRFIKTDVEGNTVWDKSYGGLVNDDPTYIIESSDGGFVATGTYNYRDIFLFKLDSNGDLLWQNLYTDLEKTNSQDMYTSKCVQQTYDGGYIIAGSYYSKNQNLMQTLLLKTDNYGVIQWNKTYINDATNRGLFVIELNTGDFIVYCFKSGPTLIKTSADGDMVWTKSYELSGDTYKGEIHLTTDGGFIIANDEIIKTNANGILLWNMENEGSCYSIQQTKDGGYITSWQSNEGVKLAKISMTSGQADGDGTPGFEILIMFISLILIILIKRKLW
jgi:hypothetical protein